MGGRIKNPDRVRWPFKIAILTKYGTETDFAKVLGMSRQQLTHIIVGRNPGWHIREKSSELLGLSEAYLFGYDNSKDSRAIKDQNGFCDWSCKLINGFKKWLRRIRESA